MLLNRAQEEQGEARAWQLYCALRPYMERPVSYQDWVNQHMHRARGSTETTEEILARAEAIKVADQGQVNRS